MSNQYTGLRVGAPNAEVISRRNVQLQRWSESDMNKSMPKTERRNRIQFESKFMFLDSVAQQDEEEVQALLALGVDVNHTNPDGISALHQVSIDGNEEIAKILLQHHPSLNAPDNDGWTPLHAAAQCGFIELAKLLLEHGADVSCVDNEGELPLDKAEETDMQELLSSWMRRKGVNMELVRTAEERRLRDACEKAIRSRSKDLDAVTIDGATILHCAAAKGLPDCISMLARSGINMNLQDFDGWTPLHAAARWAQPEAIVSLIENGADIHVVNTFAETPYDIADEDVLDMLKEYYNKSGGSRNNIVVPGVQQFLNPFLPDKSKIHPITKGSRKLRENKENQPEKLSTITIEEAKKAEEPKKRNRFEKEPAAAVETKAGPAPTARLRTRDNAEKDVTPEPGPSRKPWQKPATAEKRPAEEPKKLELEVPSKKPISHFTEGDGASNAPEIVRKQVSRRKRDERRSTQHVNMDDILLMHDEDGGSSDLPVKDIATNGPDPQPDLNKKRNALPMVQITDSGTLAWDSKKSPDTENSPSGESASNKAEIVRKKVARRKRDERRSTQHVSMDDILGNNEKLSPEDTVPDSTDLLAKEDHMSKELELERLRYEESSAALTRNQEDLRKREVKITTLEKENETMKKKIAELEEDLRSLQQVKNDNQRLRDENAALIRVIGKLSRNPL